MGYKFIDDVEEAMKLGLVSYRARSVHFHTLNSKPLIGGSTAKGLVGGGQGLMQWYADQAAVAGLSYPQQDIRAEYERVQAITDSKIKAKERTALDKKYPDYANARRAANKSRDESAKQGTFRHGVLEDYIRECLQENEGKPINATYADIQMFVKWSVANVKKFYFTESYCYSERLWAGGIADLGLELLDGRRLVGDHKSSKEAYPDQFLQCAIYDTLLIENGGLTKTGQKLFDWEPADGYIVFPFRSKPFKPEIKMNVQAYRQGANDLFGLYKLLELGQENPYEIKN